MTAPPTGRSVQPRAVLAPAINRQPSRARPPRPPASCAQVWDLRTNKPSAELRGHTGSVTCVGSYQWQLASGGGFNRGADNDTVLSVDSSIRLWDLRTMAPVWQKEVPPPPGGTAHPKGDPVLCLQLLHDKILTTHGGKDWTARVWQVER